jgi:3-phosphoshikimate 1-carboxyvinyltransferase
LTVVRLTVRPGPPLAGRFTPPGDKSITHRACLLALLSAGITEIRRPNPGEDCASSVRCAEDLGLVVLGRPGEGDAGSGVLRLRGLGGALVEPRRVLDCGNSGTTLRLLAGIVASRPLLSVLAGDASLNRRPVARIVEPLRRMGATVCARDHDRFPPLVVKGAGLVPLRYAVPVASAQVATCVLLAGLSAAGETSVELPGPARDHTERMLAAAGIPLEREDLPGGGRRVTVRGPAVPRPLSFTVPADFSAAAFFLAAAAATPGGRVTATDVNLNPTRTGLLDVLAGMGAGVEVQVARTEAGEEVGDVTVTGPEHLVGFDIPPEWVPRLIDEIPAWAVAASAARGRSRLGGAGELRHKESDRLAVLAANLSGLGVGARERADGLEIEGGPVRAGTIDAAGDHRIAMAFAVLATRATGPVTIGDAGSIATSFPGFAATLAALGGQVESAEAGVVPR